MQFTHNINRILSNNITIRREGKVHFQYILSFVAFLTPLYICQEKIPKFGVF